MGKFWFETPGAPGDRTLQQQLQGLESLMQGLEQRRADELDVLDVGCAEGLIALECARHGAGFVLGAELRPDAVKRARSLTTGHPVRVVVADANVWEPPGSFEVVLLLAVLHKLRDPSEACLRFAASCAELCVIRLPPAGAPVIVDARSGNKPHHIGQVMTRAGFDLAHVSEGPACDGRPPEWVGYFVRKALA